jgi:hypothetical protein
LKLFVTVFGLLLLSGCASRGVIENAQLNEATPIVSYSVKTAAASRRGSGDVALILSFSGGGTRAAALAYGVMKELRTYHCHGRWEATAKVQQGALANLLANTVGIDEAVAVVMIATGCCARFGATNKHTNSLADENPAVKA